MNFKKIQNYLFVLILIIFILLFFVKKDKKEKTVNNDLLNEMKISFLDIGQGDSILIDFKDDKQMLVDCAEDGVVLEALGRNMDYYDKTIDYLLITHAHSDHYGGCEEIINRFEVKNIIYNGLEVDSNQSWQSFLNSAREKEINFIIIKEEQTWEIASSSLHFLYPDRNLIYDLEENLNLNNTSIVFSLDFNSTTILFTGDAEEDIEKYLLQTYDKQLDSDILKAGHHGSDTSSDLDFLNLVNPSDTVISVGIGNSHGHPSRRILKRLERIYTNIWRTDLMGDIILEIGEGGYEIITPQIE